MLQSQKFIEKNREKFLDELILLLKIPSVSADPNLSKIGAALQSSNLYAAQHFGQEIQNRSVQPQASTSAAHVAKKSSDRQIGQNIYSGLTRVDLSA